MVTLLLTSLAFTLIYSLGQLQAKMSRHQQLKERFIVDADAFLSVLEEDLSTAFVATGTSGTQILQIGHCAKETSAQSGVAPFNSEPFPDPELEVEEPDFRGPPLQTTYTLNEDTLVRSSRVLPLAAPAYSTLPILGGLNAADATINQSTVEIRLTLVSDGSVHTLERFLFAPGLAP